MNRQFKPIKKKKHLEMFLQSIPGHQKPKVELEQYSTPSIIAADILWNAYTLGDIKNKNFLDLGCGTGIFAMGSAILGSEHVWGIDIDENAIEMARETTKEKQLDDKIKFIQLNIKNNFNIYELFDHEIDTVIQNPPFGSQERAEKGADRVFMEKSIQIAPVIYSFHMAETEEFVEKYFSKLGGKVTHKFFYHFPLPKIYHFHKEESKDIEVIVLRVERSNK